MLIHVFKPLLGDAFSSSVTGATFEALGIRDDFSSVARYFGEWAMTLSVNDICRTGLLMPKSPLNRFVQDLACRQLERVDMTDETVLGDLYLFCQKSEDLLRSLIVAVLCRNGSELASGRKEKSTYGKILSSGVIGPWDTLLRKLRIAILLHIKLRRVRLVAPITVANLEDGLFSVYELLAHDELSVSTNNEEIVALETACRGSPYAFDPFTTDGDEPRRMKQIHESCLSAVVGEEERSEYLLDFEDGERFGLLLLFFPRFNQAHLLACHRVRLLAHKWLQNPDEFKYIDDACVTLKCLSQTCEMSRLVLALSLDLWHSVMCPIYRARLIGFHDAHEIDEQVFAPFLVIATWMKRFGRLACQLLDLIKSIPWTDDSWDSIVSAMNGGDVDPSWPSHLDDYVLKGLVEKSRKVDAATVDVHVSIVCSLILSEDVNDMYQCIPNMYDCFGARSLYSPLNNPSGESVTVRAQFLEAALISVAAQYDGPPMESFQLGECTKLSHIWGIDPSHVHTLFLQLMYEVGKDTVVGELMIKGTALYKVDRFIDIGVDIVCLRLHAFLSSKEMQSPDMRGTLGMLDADLCEWIQQRAKTTHCLVPHPKLDVPLALTHLLALHLLNLSATSNIETALRGKIHSLTVSCGVLVQVKESRAQQNIK